MADYKAVSTNLMHGNIQITDGIYAPLASAEVKQRVVGLLGQSLPSGSDQPVDQTFADNLTDSQLAAVLTTATARLAR